MVHKTFDAQRDGTPYIVELGANWVVCLLAPLTNEAKMSRYMDYRLKMGQRIPYGIW